MNDLPRRVDEPSLRAVERVGRRLTGHGTGMTTQPDPADGTLVEREGVNAGSDRSTAERPVPSAESALSGGSTTGLPADRPGVEGPDTTPSQVGTDSAGGVAAQDAPYGTESGQDDGLLS